MNRSAQRARKPNYTKEETETLLDQLILCGQLLFNKHQPVNNQQKADVWANIAMQVNSVPNSAGRTVDELKHRWQDMAQRARHAIRKKSSHSSNSGGKTPAKPVPFLHKILQILGESYGGDIGKSLSPGQSSMFLTSVDSTPYSSDSSCAANVKEEFDDHYQSTVSAIEFHQNNGSSMTNGLKRPYSETIDCAHVPGENEMTNNNSNVSSVTDSLPSTTLSHSSSTPHNKNLNDYNGNTTVSHEERFESKRRRMKKSSNPRKSVSSSFYHVQSSAANHDNTNTDDNEVGRIQHKHIETFRSMVLDPESDIVMEVEDEPGLEEDAESGSSTASTSNPPSGHNNNNNIDDFNSYVEDGSDRWEYPVNGSHQQRYELRGDLEGEISTRPDCDTLPVVANAAHHHDATFRNKKQPSNLPRGQVNNNNNSNNNIKTNSKKIKDTLLSLSRLQGDDRGSLPRNSLGHTLKAQQLQQQYLKLDSLSKPDLDRRCVISQIQMQDQRTRYLLLKEQKIQMEIELLKGKCACRSTSATKANDNFFEMNFTPKPNPNLHPKTNTFQACHSRGPTQQEGDRSIIMSRPRSQLAEGGEETEFDQQRKEFLSSTDGLPVQTSKRSEFEDKQEEEDTCGLRNDQDGSGHVNHTTRCDNGDTNGKSDDENNNDEDDDDDDDVDGEGNEEDDDEEEDVSLVVSFGDGDNGRMGDYSVSSNNGEAGRLFGSESAEPRPGEDWEKHLRKNMEL